MSLLAPWWLAGLLALVPLLALHLRRRRRRLEVDSLLLWREQAGAAPARRRARLVPSLLLLLQALVVVLLVAALARPTSDGATPAAGPPPAIFVLDASAAMAATDVAPDRLAVARRQLDARLARLPAATPVTVVLAEPTPRLLVSGATPRDARDALAALPLDGAPARAAAGSTAAPDTSAAARRSAAGAADAVPAAAGTADLRAALALAAGQLHRRGGTIALLHARGVTPPAVRAEGVRYEAIAIGAAAAGDVAIETASARCAPPPPAAKAAPPCTVFAAVRNTGARAVDERLVVERDGRETHSRALTVAPGERVELAFAADAGARLTLRLTAPDALAADDAATVVVPSADRPDAAPPAAAQRPDTPGSPAATPGADRSAADATTVVLVGDRPASGALARALAATPGVRLRLVAPADYDGEAAASADLVVFDRWLPDGALPDAGSLLLVAPPRLPGGSVGAPLAEPVLSGSDEGDPLLAGVDLDGLAIAAGAARRTTLPPSLRALAWTPGGPLLATGATPGDRPGRTTVLTFDPAASTLPQLPAFPALLANVVAAAAASAPATTPIAPAPDPAAGPAAESAAAAPAASATRPLVIRVSDGGGPLPPPPHGWWPWLVAAGLLALLAEWSYPRWARRREAGA